MHDASHPSEETGINPSIPARPGVAAAGQTPATSAATPLLDSQDLLRGQNAVAITHNGALYRLQTTRQGKLILTK